MSENLFPFSVNPWPTVQENKEYSTPIFNLLKRHARLDIPGDSRDGDFYILEAPAWINVMAFTPEDDIILVEQYRHGIKAPTLEIPGGMVDPGETPLQAARRELQEETGYRSDQWHSLGKVSSNPAILSNYTHMFVAEQCAFEGMLVSDDNERIKVHTIPLEQFLEHVREGAVHHAIVLAAVARYLLRRGR